MPTGALAAEIHSAHRMARWYSRNCGPARWAGPLSRAPASGRGFVICRSARATVWPRGEPLSHWPWGPSGHPGASFIVACGETALPRPSPRPRGAQRDVRVLSRRPPRARAEDLLRPGSASATRTAWRTRSAPPWRAAWAPIGPSSSTWCRQARRPRPSRPRNADPTGPGGRRSVRSSGPGAGQRDHRAARTSRAATTRS